MKPLNVFLFGAAFIVAASSPAQAGPCAGTAGFTLICRGNLQIQNHGNNPSRKDLSFEKSPNAAGATGSTLTPGTCAWEDRPLNGAEPSRLTYSISAANAGNQGWFSLVSQCAFDNRCTIEVCVQNDASSGFLNTLSDHAVVRFPF
jgi:hypothetical protein